MIRKFYHFIIEKKIHFISTKHTPKKVINRNVYSNKKKNPFFFLKIHLNSNIAHWHNETYTLAQLEILLDVFTIVNKRMKYVQNSKSPFKSTFTTNSSYTEQQNIYWYELLGWNQRYGVFLVTRSTQWISFELHLHLILSASVTVRVCRPIENGAFCCCFTLQRHSTIRDTSNSIT